MSHEKPTQDPLFVKISEDTDLPGSLQVAPVAIRPGDTLTIANRPYIVEPLRTPEGAFAIRNKTDDLRGNIAAFNLLRRAGALPADCEIDDLCLRNPKNGDCAIELCHDGPASHDDPLVQPQKRHFFSRLDASIQNPHLNESDFDEIIIRGSSCMFGTKSAKLKTATGEHILLVERSAVVDRPITELLTRNEASMYEREILRRFIGVITLLLRGGKVSRFVAALPRGAYYSFPIAGAALGFIAPEKMMSWFDRVDKRVAMLRERYESAIASVAPSFKIEEYSFMDSACDTMRDFFRRRLGHGAARFSVSSLLADVIEAMKAKDPFAHYIFSSGVPQPATFRELADLTYAVTNLVEMGEQTNKKVLVIGVYDPTENIMWNEARKIRYRSLLEPRGLYRDVGPGRSKLDSLSYVGIMPMEQVMIDVSSEYADRHFSGGSRLVALEDSMLAPVDKNAISSIFGVADGKGS